MNLFNIRKGDLIYKDLINVKPKIAYVNEQTYSKSLINIYKKNLYKALIIDWNNFILLTQIGKIICNITHK